MLTEKDITELARRERIEIKPAELFDLTVKINRIVTDAVGLQRFFERAAVVENIGADNA